MNGVVYAVRAEKAGLNIFIVALRVVEGDENGTQYLGL
jgi:hypothetical protein